MSGTCAMLRSGFATRHSFATVIGYIPSMPVHSHMLKTFAKSLPRRNCALGFALLSGIALAMMAGAAAAQSPQPYYTGKALGGDSVTVDLGVLDKLGQPASLPERLRGMGGVAAPPASAPMASGPTPIVPPPDEAPRSGLAVDAPVAAPPAALASASAPRPAPVPAPAAAAPATPTPEQGAAVAKPVPMPAPKPEQSAAVAKPAPVPPPAPAPKPVAVAPVPAPAAPAPTPAAQAAPQPAPAPAPAQVARQAPGPLQRPRRLPRHLRLHPSPPW